MAKTITVHLLAPDGTRHRIEGRTGRSLMRAAIEAGFDSASGGVAADCGGCLTCATCHVVVDAAWVGRLSPPAPDEQAMLEMTATPAEATSRLSCQIELTPTLDGLQVRLPPTQY